MTNQITEQTNPFFVDEAFDYFNSVFYEVEDHLFPMNSERFEEDDRPIELPSEMFSRCEEIQNEFVDLFEKLVNLEGDIKDIINDPSIKRFTDIRWRVNQ